ncbi:MAG: DUF167 domain-containing protein [Acidimicrobiales bacterium]
MRIPVHAHPGSRRRAITVRDGQLEAYVVARAVDGAANDDVRRVLADALGVSLRDVSIVRGARARHKVLAVAGDEDELARRLDALRSRASPPELPTTRGGPA